LRGDRRGGEPATRTESANAEAAGGCGSFNIETTPINVQEAADIERAVSAFAQFPNSGMITAVSAAALERKDLIIKLATQFRLPVVYAYRVFVAHGGLMSYATDIIGQTVQTRCRLR
jgi:putative ABC transport system substrate-binding protein